MGKFCEKCPRKLNAPPGEACPLALETVNNRIAGGRRMEDDAPKCPWAINSATHNYCFWNLAEHLDNDPIPDKEVCQLLNMSQTCVDRTLARAIQKTKALRGTPEVDHWIELLKDRINSTASDDTVYFPDHFRTSIETANEPEEILSDEEKLANELDSIANEKEKKKKRLKKSGMPVHRSESKLDIYGLYSKKTLERIKNEKNKK